MKLLKFVIGLAVVVGLTACGGGGGNPGTNTSGTGPGTGTSTGTVPVATPTMALTVVDVDGADIATHVLSQTQTQFLKIVLKDAKGAAVPYTRVTVTLDSTEATLVPVSGTQLTDSLGVVLMRIAPASVNSSGTVLATAGATVDGTVLPPKTYDFQINAGTVSLSVVSVSPSSVQKGQSVNVNVDVKVNGAPAASNSVAVNFTSSCGTVTPTSALVDTVGRASAVIQTTSTGSCTVDASVNGITTLPVAYTVTAPPITGLQFVSATPNLLYQSGSAGVNTSIVKFKVIDSVAAGVLGVTVNASLTTSDGGINFCGSPAFGNSNADGFVTFSVCAGTLPATVQVRAELASTPAVFTNSNLLTVQTGLPTQRFFDISATKFNFYAGGYFTSKVNGKSVSISVFAADRQGNPVPDGTKIVFVSEGGQINSGGQSSCLIASGRCNVELIGQDYRPMGSAAAGGDPRPGRVTVLAYADGEESFIDKPDANGNYNNRYEAGELFEDLGSPYIDKDENGNFLSAYTNLVTGTNEGESSYPLPANAVGSEACPTNSNTGLSVSNTCNKKWDGYTKVRRQMVIVFSGGEIGHPLRECNGTTITSSCYHSTIPAIHRTQIVGVPSKDEISVQLADYDGNPLPADASLSVEVIPSTGDCKATLLGSKVGSTIEPTTHTATLETCTGGETIRFKASVAGEGSDLESAFDVKVP